MKLKNDNLCNYEEKCGLEDQNESITKIDLKINVSSGEIINDDSYNIHNVLDIQPDHLLLTLSRDIVPCSIIFPDYCWKKFVQSFLSSGLI